MLQTRLTRILTAGIILSLGLMMMLTQFTGAAYLKDVPITLKQPNGTTIRCYATGDEFFRFFHDSNGYAIRKNPDTGYYVYVSELSNGKLAASPIVVGTVNPRAVESKFNLKIAPETMKAYRKDNLRTLVTEPEQAASPAPTLGIINNIVIFIRFADETEFTTPLTYYSGTFNADGPADISLHNYFDWTSYRQLDIDTYFYPIPSGDQVISYQDIHNRGYFEPYSPSNPEGYATEGESTDREWTLLRDAVNSVAGMIDPLLDVDTDADGYVDNVVFIVIGGPGDWSDLLWPHKWWLGYTAYINGARVGAYNFQLNDFLLDRGGVGVLCHEMFHSLGAPDLYEYGDQSAYPVGFWDIMDVGSYADPPASMGSYMKRTYGNWISSIPEITTQGVYTLNPLGSSMGVNECYKIASPYSTNEYFVLEYRSKMGFDAGIPGSGLLVYRINLEAYGEGNRNGPPDEVYVYRPGGSLTSVGDHYQANLSADVGRTAINDTTDPWSFLSTGLPGGLDISEVGSVGPTIQFRVNMFRINPPYEYTWNVGVPVTDTLSAAGGTPPYNWTVSPASSYESSVLGSSMFAPTGVGQSAHADDACWTYVLPFSFPFYGQNYSSVYICSNGFLDFMNSSPDYSNSISDLTARVCIAPFWEDLTTYSPDDIYIDESTPDQMTIRWNASIYGSSYPVSFSVVLFSDGRIRLDYGPGNTGAAPTIGISAGNFSDYIVVSGYDGSSNLANAASVLFEPSGLPDEVVLDPLTGVFSGFPTTVGDYTVGIRATDSSIPSKTAVHNFDFHVVETLPLAPSNPVPTNGATDVLLSTSLTWNNAVPPSGVPETYNVYFGTSPGGMSLIANDITDTIFSPGTLISDSSYYWQIIAENIYGQTPGPVWLFKTVKATVSGTITLQSFNGDITTIPIAVELRNHAGGTTTTSVNLDGSGNYILTDVALGTYDIAFKGPHWLRKVVPDVVVAGDVTGVDASLVNGDCNNDNQVSAADLVIVRRAYGSTPGSPRWDERADLNGDGQVSAADLIVIRRNYGKTGDI